MRHIFKTIKFTCLCFFQTVSRLLEAHLDGFRFRPLWNFPRLLRTCLGIFRTPLKFFRTYFRLFLRLFRTHVKSLSGLFTTFADLFKIHRDSPRWGLDALRLFKAPKKLFKTLLDFCGTLPDMLKTIFMRFFRNCSRLTVRFQDYCISVGSIWDSLQFVKKKLFRLHSDGLNTLWGFTSLSKAVSEVYFIFKISLE